MWILEYEGDQFIFVPGQKNVTLGWDTDKIQQTAGRSRRLKLQHKKLFI